MTDDIVARLDRAITEARRQAMLSIHKCWNECAELEDASAYHRHEPCDAALDRYAALVALRARYEERGRGMIHDLRGFADLDAEAERLLGSKRVSYRQEIDPIPRIITTAYDEREDA